MNLKKSAMTVGVTAAFCTGGLAAPAAQASSIVQSSPGTHTVSHDGPSDVLDAKCAYEAKAKGADPSICDKSGKGLSEKEKTCVAAEWIGAASIIGSFFSGGTTLGLLFTDSAAGGSAVLTCLKA